VSTTRRERGRPAPAPALLGAQARAAHAAGNAGRPTVEFAARQRHVTAVRRSMGAKPGSGGSAGLAWPERGAAREVFPDLWAARTVR
jgi:hypothetical protein